MYKSYQANFPQGNAFNSRINLNLREDKGWTYGARSNFTGDENSGEFAFSSGIKAGATDSALVEVMKELRDYAANGPTDAEVDFMKNAVGQRDALAYETGIQKAAFIRRILDYNLPANYTAQQAKILQGMTKKDMQKMAQQYLKPQQMNILLVGDKARILENVKKLGYEVVEIDADGKRVGTKKTF